MYSRSKNISVRQISKGTICPLCPRVFRILNAMRQGAIAPCSPASSAPVHSQGKIKVKQKFPYHSGSIVHVGHFESTEFPCLSLA